MDTEYSFLSSGLYPMKGRMKSGNSAPEVTHLLTYSLRTFRVWLLKNGRLQIVLNYKYLYFIIIYNIYIIYYNNGFFFKY